MSSSSEASPLTRVISGAVGASRILWGVAALGLLGGIGFRAFGESVPALWFFTVMAVAVALVLPMPLALVSPLYVGLAGWIVDMLPFVMLAGWIAVSARWVVGLVRERRLPRGGRWIWLPIGLLFWTSLGAIVVNSKDFKHFVLLFGIQVVSSAAILMAVDQLTEMRDRSRTAAGLVLFTIVLSLGVGLEYIGVPVQELQDDTASRRIEEAYGVDAFPNNIGMIKYARSSKAGSLELRRDLLALQKRATGMPDFEVFQPKFSAFQNHLVVRFSGSARDFRRALEEENVGLRFDNVGLAPANLVPRLRSFPRNALTYAGVCAALAPVAFFFAWTGDGRRRWLGRLGVAACLFGAAFSLARGAWAALAFAVGYVVIDGAVAGRRKLQFVGAYLIAALLFTGFFLVKYGVDPLNARAGGGASVATRSDLYKETVNTVDGKYLVLGFGTEKPRTESGTVKEGNKYVPRAGTHSTYLNYLFRTGIPGAAALIALYAIAGLHARAASRQRDGEERTFSTLLAACVVVAAAHGIILSLYVEPIYTLIVSLVMGLAMAGGTGLPGSVLPWRATRRTA